VARFDTSVAELAKLSRLCRADAPNNRGRWFDIKAIAGFVVAIYGHDGTMGRRARVKVWQESMHVAVVCCIPLS
jgi:hypothetical protein